MKKSISIAILLLLLVLGLWGGAAYWFGAKTEEQYRALLEQTSQGPYVRLLSESYRRGFFGSKAQTILEIRQPPGVGAEDQSIRLILESDITHGPFPLRVSPDGKWQIQPVMAIIETGIVLSPETRELLAELYTEIPELSSVRDYEIINLDGSGEEHLLIPAFQHSFGSENKAAVDWKGLSFQLNFTADLKGFSGSLSVPGLEVLAKDADLRIKEVNSAFNLHEGISGLSLGEASFDVAGFEFVEKKEIAPQSVVIRSFRANALSKASGDNINCLAAMRTDQVKLNEMSYGPGVFEMEFRNFDAASLARLQETVREFQALPQERSSETVQLMMVARLGEILPELLKKSPEIEIGQFDIKSTDGDFTGKAKVAFDGRNLESTLDLVALANALTAQAEFKVGERLLRRVASDIMKDRIIAESEEQERAVPGNEELDAIASAAIDEQLKALMAQNILVKENGDYRAAASYKAGQMVLNGRPLSLGELLQ